MIDPCIRIGHHISIQRDLPCGRCLKSRKVETTVFVKYRYENNATKIMYKARKECTEKCMTSGVLVMKNLYVDPWTRIMVIFSKIYILKFDGCYSGGEAKKQVA